MKDKEKNRSFIPRKAPKSIVVAIIAGLTGLLVGALMFGATFFGIKAVLLLGQWVFALCWAVMAASGIFFAFSLATGRYRNMQERNWRDQIW